MTAVLGGVDARHDVSIKANRLIDDVGDILHQVEQMHLRDADIAGVGEVRRVAGLNGSRHLAQEIAERLGIGGRDIEFDVVCRCKVGDRVTKLGLRRFEIFGAVNDSELARRAYR